MFSQAMSFLGQNKSRLQNEDVNEGQIVQSHQAMYGGKILQVPTTVEIACQSFRLRSYRAAMTDTCR